MGQYISSAEHCNETYHPAGAQEGGLLLQNAQGDVLWQIGPGLHVAQHTDV